MTYPDGGVYKGWVENSVPDTSRWIPYDDRRIAEWTDGATGSTYKGEVRAGVRTGDACVVADAAGTFRGPVENGVKVGAGTLEALDGTVYEGIFKSGKIGGAAIVRYPNRDVYKGKLVGGLRAGHGVLTMAGGHTYDGLWCVRWAASRVVLARGGGGTLFSPCAGLRRLNDKYEGLGTLTRKNGDVYVGQWRAGQRHGHGRMSFATGAVEDGTWERDVFVGAS
jgi:hypothetical protein